MKIIQLLFAIDIKTDLDISIGLSMLFLQIVWTEERKILDPLAICIFQDLNSMGKTLASTPFAKQVSTADNI